MLNDKVVLVTGGTGSFGKKFSEIALSKYKVKKLIIFSRDEFKQYEMAKMYPDDKYPIRYFLGDVRDKYRLCRAFEGVDYVVHAAALKQVPALEYNPTEAVKTNVDGANNVVNAAIDVGVDKVIALSTDKAVNPLNLYGATKLVAEKIFVSANAYAGGRVKFSVVRYGNVAGSRGSIIPVFFKMKESGKKVFPITDLRMTRFMITLPSAAQFVMKALQQLVGGEIFVPQLPSVNIVDLAKAITPDCEFKHTGIRPGEKIHEVLISRDEARNTKKVDGDYVILPQFNENQRIQATYSKYLSLSDGFCYSSDSNSEWMEEEDINNLIRELIPCNSSLTASI